MIKLSAVSQFEGGAFVDHVGIEVYKTNMPEPIDDRPIVTVRGATGHAFRFSDGAVWNAIIGWASKEEGAIFEVSSPPYEEMNQARVKIISHSHGAE